MKTPCPRIAVLLTAAYFFLSVFSVTCRVDHEDHRASSHHHNNHVSHSSFCAWACQANPTAGLTNQGLVLPLLFLSVPLVQEGESLAGNQIAAQVHARGPPSCFF